VIGVQESARCQFGASVFLLWLAFSLWLANPHKISCVPTFVARWVNGARGVKLGREMRRGGRHWGVAKFDFISATPGIAVKTKSKI